MQVVRRNGEIWVCEKSSPDLQNGQPRPLGMSYDTLWSFYVPTSPCRCVFVRTFYHHFPIQIIDSEIFIKVSHNPNKVAGDTQGLPTVPHNDFGELNFKGLTSKYLLLMTLPPADDEKMKKNRTSGTPTSEKTSDSAFSSKVRSTKVKLEIRNSKNWLGYAAATWGGFMPGPAIGWAGLF